MKCKDCQHRMVDWLTTYDSRGMIEFSYCNANVVTGKLIDPDVERQCADFVEVKALEVKNAS